MTSAGLYTVAFASAARRGINRLPVDVGIALFEHVNGPIAENPRRLGKPLDAPYDEVYSARRGEYRVLYSIDEEQHTITVLALGHRREIYRPR